MTAPAMVRKRRGPAPEATGGGPGAPDGGSGGGTPRPGRGGGGGGEGGPGGARPYGRPPRSARRVAAWTFPVVSVTLGIVALDHLGVGIGGLVGGFGEVAGLLARAWPPTLSDPATTFAHVLDTLWMACAGTALATVLAAVLGVLAADRGGPAVASRTARVVRSAALSVIVACRAVPDVVFAVFFVAAIGIGPLPGVLALGLHSVGMLGKLFAEAVEQADTGVREAVAGTGAGPLQRLLAGVLPQVAPSWVAAILYRLDINFRGSVLLGAVGAGGIGLDLKTAFGFTDYREATGIALVTVAVVLLVEAVSVSLRGQLLGAGRGGAVPPVRGSGCRGPGRGSPRTWPAGARWRSPRWRSGGSARAPRRWPRRPGVPYGRSATSSRPTSPRSRISWARACWRRARSRSGPRSSARWQGSRSA
ncbi:phosphonate ABC transporter, permease protein PhnE [Nonomuraea antimicrobica]